MKKFWLWLTLTIMWLCVIYGHSLMPASVSDGESGGIFQWLQQFLPWLTHNLVRKMAHFAIFAVLGGLLTGTFWSIDSLNVIKPLGCALVAALIDETIQLFVEGRSGQVSDIWLDFSGALFGTACLALLFRFISKKSTKKQSTPTT